MSTPTISRGSRRYGGELNQVWTNLFDNAADAIHEASETDGRIVIRAFPEGDSWCRGRGQRPGIAASDDQPGLRLVLHHEAPRLGNRASGSTSPIRSS